jgi:hypothetical protein
MTRSTVETLFSWIVKKMYYYFEYHCGYTGPHAWYSTGKELVIGLKRANQMQPQGIGFIQSKSDKGVINAKDNMVRKRVDVEDIVLIGSLPTKLQRATSHSVFDDELIKKHNLYKL